MNRYSGLAIFFLLSPFFTLSQVLPPDGSSLNYRLIGFSFPEFPATSGCRLEIARGNILSEDSFRKNVVVRIDVKSNRQIAEVPEFGTEYTWRTTGGPQGRKSRFYHFRTSMIPNVDTGAMRLRILKMAGKYEDAYVFMDGSLALYDMRGKPVWFLPINDELHTNKGIDTRDLKLTPAGTITFLNDGVFEVDYDGKVLWKGPGNGILNNPGKEMYHHQYTRLGNGHYLAMGNEFVPFKPGARDSMPARSPGPGRGRTDSNSRKMRYGTLLEYDEAGNLVWSWKSSKYFDGPDIPVELMPFKGRFTHDNAFFFDESEKVIYISFKAISTVIKISYPGGEIQNVYTGNVKQGSDDTEDGLFCGQHCCNVTRTNDLYLYNNNDCHRDSLPSIVVMKQPGGVPGKLQKLWEYQCPVEPEDKEKGIKIDFVAGGSVQELPDGSFLASMGTNYSKVFVVNRAKKVLWSAMLEKWNPDAGNWEKVHLYKASMVTNPKDLEKLIWNTEKSRSIGK